MNLLGIDFPLDRLREGVPLPRTILVALPAKLHRQVDGCAASQIDGARDRGGEMGRLEGERFEVSRVGFFDHPEGRALCPIAVKGEHLLRALSVVEVEADRRAPRSGIDEMPLSLEPSSK